MGNDDLPSGWARTDLATIIEEAQPGFACGERDESGYVQLRMNNIGLSGNVVLNSTLRIPKNLTNLAKYGLRKDDVIFNNTNSAELVGKTVLFKGELQDTVYSNHLTRLRVRAGVVYPEWVTWLLVYEQLSGTFERMCHRFVGQASVSRSDLLRLPVRLPPYAEQIRIATKIEGLFQDLATIREIVQKVPSMVKQLRYSLLAKAFRGEVTEQNSEDEPVAKVIERLRQEKSQDFNLEKDHSADAFLDEIPDRWKSIELGALVKDVKNGLYPRKNLKGPRCVILRIQDMQNGVINTAGLLRQRVTEEEFRQFKLQPGDIILDRVNAGINLVGKVAIFDLNEDAVFNYHLMRIRVRETVANPRFLKYFLETPAARRYIEDVSVSTAGQNSINQKQLAALVVPIAPMEEEKRIVNSLDSMLSHCNMILQQASQVEDISASLEQSILAKAFRGELVPQYSREEAASLTLERTKKSSRA